MKDDQFQVDLREELLPFVTAVVLERFKHLKNRTIDRTPELKLARKVKEKKGKKKTKRPRTEETLEDATKAAPAPKRQKGRTAKSAVFEVDDTVMREESGSTESNTMFDDDTHMQEEPSGSGMDFIF